MTAVSDLWAGVFSSWVDEMQAAIRGEADADVPCGDCIACCTSSQFIHIAPDELDALKHIPKALLFPAPRMPKGNVLLGYDAQGRCPMLIDSKCSIYEHRPRTCRTYDCRMFPATGIEPNADDKPLIVKQARRWTFTFPTAADEVVRSAVLAAATFLRERATELPDGAVPRNETQLAVLAFELRALFIGNDEAGIEFQLDPELETVRDELIRRNTWGRANPGPRPDGE